MKNKNVSCFQKSSVIMKVENDGGYILKRQNYILQLKQWAEKERQEKEEYKKQIQQLQQQLLEMMKEQKDKE